MEVGRTFLERVASSPDINSILAKLIFNEKLRIGERHLLFSGFRAWVHFPDNLLGEGDREQQLILAVVRKIGALERRATLSKQIQDQLEAIHRKRLSPKYRWLYEEIFLPWGGMDHVPHLRSSLRHAILCRQQLYKLQVCYRLLAIVHTMVDFNAKSEKPANRRIAIDDAMRRYEEIYSERRRTSKRHLWDIWSEMKPSASFIYAGLSPLSSATPVPPLANSKTRNRQESERVVPWTDDCLLNIIPTFPKGYRRYMSDFRRLIARAKFVDQKILDRCVKAARNAEFAFPDTIDLEIVPVPEFTSAERAIIVG